MEKIIVYTDGSALENGSKRSKCGWACKLMYRGGVKMKSGRETGKTNNQMEIIAVLEAMKSITDKTIPVEIYSDSRYVVDTLNGRYAMKKNMDLWEQIIEQRKLFANIRFYWVKGHDKNEHNIDVDRAAVEAARRKERI